ncbi:FAD-binding protein [Salidesulfovibrio brasiliensis]
MIGATTDLLVLGSGLAGLRAAWAAREACPTCAVLVACRRPGPSGSSFANRNDALGVQVPLDDAEREAFVQEVLDLGRPGFVDAKLVQILAEEGRERFEEMFALGLRFRGDAEGLKRFPGCGSRRPGAYIFDGLRQTFARFEHRAATVGVNFNSDITVLGLLVGEAGCHGVWGLDGAGQRVVIRARAVIMAAGGPAPLFRHRVCGPANDGTSPALLQRAGCELRNTGCLQFLWYTRDKEYVCPASLAGPEARIIADGREIAPEFDPDLLSMRRTHCPAFIGRPDTVIDRWLSDHAADDGFVTVRTSKGVVEVAPMAHAGNGGAIIGLNGETSVPGLFAVGECATGMHGANRLGGAMVLATQVFGKRAGEAAADHALSAVDIGPGGVEVPEAPGPVQEEVISRIREGMQCFAAPYAKEGLAGFAAELAATARRFDGTTGLTAEAAHRVANGYLTDDV